MLGWKIRMPAKPMAVRLSKPFQKQLQKADPIIRQSFKRNIRLFMDDPFHPRLHNHMLSGRYHGYRSINITSDWRAVYSTRVYVHGRVKSNVIIFEALGTHSQLYQ